MIFLIILSSALFIALVFFVCWTARLLKNNIDLVEKNDAFLDAFAESQKSKIEQEIFYTQLLEKKEEKIKELMCGENYTNPSKIKSRPL